MTYIRFKKGKAKVVSLRDVRRDHPNVSMPADPPKALLASYGVFPVTFESPPAIGPNQVRTRDDQPTVKSDGTYVWGWTVRNKTQTELDAEDVQRVASIKADLEDGGQSAIKVLMKICFQQENRIRSLEGSPAVTAQQFRTYVQSQIE